MCCYIQLLNKKSVFIASPGLTLALIDGLTLLRALTLAHKRGVAELDGLIGGNLLVLNEAALLEVLLALLLLLGLKVCGVGGVAPLAVAMLADNLLVILSLLYHHNLKEIYCSCTILVYNF